MNFKKKLVPFKPFLYNNQLPIIRWNLLLEMEKGKFDQETVPWKPTHFRKMGGRNYYKPIKTIDLTDTACCNYFSQVTNHLQ